MDYKAVDDVQYIEDSIPSMLLQPVLGHGLPQQMPPLFSVCCSSPHPRILSYCSMSLQMTSSHLVQAIENTFSELLSCIKIYTCMCACIYIYIIMLMYY